MDEEMTLTDQQYLMVIVLMIMVYGVGFICGWICCELERRKK
jgi:hypothetical protein